MILNYQRCNRTEIHLVEIADGYVPSFLAVFHIQRHEITIRRLEVEPVAIRRGATASNVNATLRLPGKVPHFAARARVDSPGVVREREVQNTVQQERCCFDSSAETTSADVGAIDPCQTERTYVGIVELV